MKTPVDRARLVPAHADEVKTRQLKVHVLIHKHARRRSKLRGAELASRRGSVGGDALRASVCFQRGLDLYEGAGGEARRRRGVRVLARGRIARRRRRDV